MKLAILAALAAYAIMLSVALYAFHALTTGAGTW